MKVWQFVRCPPGGFIPTAGVVLLAAWIPLSGLPSLRGAQVVQFLCSFGAAGLAYIWAVRRLNSETPPLWLVWGFAAAFRLVLLATPVSLSDDVYRYIWDGHLLTQGINPYALPVQSPLLDGFATPLRQLVDFPAMATPYLPAAQAYFGLVEGLAPQSPFAFQLGAVVLDLAAAAVLTLVLIKLGIPARASLIYLWNPLVVVEFSHGAHIDALMLFFFALAVWGLASRRQGGLTLSALALAASVLVKGWPVLVAPIFIQRWGAKRLVLFGLSAALPLAWFAATAGWGLSGPPDGRGVFGALRIYAATWRFNSGLYIWIARAIHSDAARLVSVLVPGLTGVFLAWRWHTHKALPGGARVAEDPAACDRRLIRWSALIFGLYLVLAPTIHPWYLTLVLLLLPFFWPADGETGAARRWIWPWMYFMFFEAITYLTYSGIRAPGTAELELLQTMGYIPFWLLLIWASLSTFRISLDFLHIRIKNQ